MSEHDKRLAVQGPPGPEGSQGRQGEQGDKGEQGNAALSIPVRRALVYLFVLSTLLAGANFLWSAHQQNAYEASLHAAHTTRQRADDQTARELCLTFGKLAALEPPAGAPETNPSRAYEQQLHATLVQFGTDLGCRS